MNLNRIIRIISAALSIYFFSEFVSEIRASDTNVFLMLVHLICGCYLGYFSLFGSKPIFSDPKEKEIESFDLSDEILDIVDNAIANAEFWGHGSATTEHLLYALLKDNESSSIIKACGGNIDKINDSLNFYFKQKLENNQNKNKLAVKISDELRQTVKNAIKRAISSEQKPEGLTSGYILASLLEREDSFSYKILIENKISRLKILKYLSHQGIDIRGFNTTEEIPVHYKHGIWKVIIYNDNFTTMEFVCSLLSNLFNKSKERAIEMMLDIHKSGFSICGKYEYAEAVDKMKKVDELSRKSEFPLMCTIEKEKQE